MYRQGSRTLGGPSKATATTLCQKCLRKGHYSYECTVTAQERPYSARPSRSQQLLNPKLVPALTSDVPKELFQKKGVADEHLAKTAKDRGRKRQREDLDDPENEAKSARRSASTTSSASVSTISTRSPSPPKTRSIPKERKSSSGKDVQIGQHWRKSVRREGSNSSSSSGYSSHGSDIRARKDVERPQNSDLGGSRGDFQRHRLEGSQREHTRSPPLERQRTHLPNHRDRPRLRSMSPYSKRIALTQAMNG